MSSSNHQMFQVSGTEKRRLTVARNKNNLVTLNNLKILGSIEKFWKLDADI